MRYEKRKNANDLLKKIEKNPKAYFVIHYSCESFYDTAEGQSPRITSIAVRSFSSGQVRSFSIHKIAEKEHKAFSDIEQYYDDLEKKMLNEYYSYLKNNRSFSWIHWNMRNPNYGFQALDHRYIVLGGKPENIPDENKVDISLLLQDKFGSNYIDNPKLQNIIKLNKMGYDDLLTGEAEAEAFRNKEFIKLHLSTIAKVTVLAAIVNRTLDGKLKTKAKWHEIYGITPQGIFDFCKDKWYIQLTFWGITIVVSWLIGKFL